MKKKNKNILVLNVGSSSIKYCFFENDKRIIEDNLERVKDFNKKIKEIIEKIRGEGYKIDAIGHRVVHGKEISHSVKINKKILKKIEEASSLAPLHNPPEIKAIKVCLKNFKIPNIAVFDTSFHQTMPDYASMYPIPKQFYKKYGVRKYGFHGTSHKYVAEEAAKVLKKKNPTLITCHLGNGCSITAIKKGKSVDTSMGLTPLEGLMMGTRSGDIDPGIFEYLKRKGYSVKSLNKILNKNSGLLGVSGFSNDMRDILKKKSKNKDAKLAYDMFVYRVKKYIGSYVAILGKVDAVVFTAGVSREKRVRNAIKKGLEHLPIKKFLHIRTDEEFMIKKEVESLLK